MSFIYLKESNNEIYTMTTKLIDFGFNDHLCVRLKAGIYGDIHGVQAIWDTDFSTKKRVFYLSKQNTFSTRSTVLECCGQFTIYLRPDLVLF